VFDASAALALLQGETGADKLSDLQADALIGSVNVAEVLAKLVSRGMPLQDAQDAFEALHLEVVSFEPASALASAKYVSKGVSLGDRCFLAAAHQFGYGLTSDHDLTALLGSVAPQLKFFR
jgi:PIN domain nuclease of toxin-antitoxin system